MKNRKKPKPLNVLDWLFYFTLIFFLVASVWDLSVTLTAWKFDPSLRAYEANKLFTWGIDVGLPMPLNPSIIVNFAIPLVLWWFFESNKDKPTLIKSLIVVIGTCATIASAGFHIMGGASWLY